MKKKLIITVLLFVLAFIFASCGSANPYKGLNLDEYITPGAFPEVEYDKSELESSIKEEIDYFFSDNKELKEVDREAADGDTVEITFKVVCDSCGGKEVEKLSKTDFAFDLSSEDEELNFLKEELKGKKAGDEFSAKRTLAADYEEEEFAGKEVTYTGKIGKVSESVMAELTDELVASKDLGYSTKDEYMAHLNDEHLKNILWQNLLKNTEVKKYPEDHLKTLYENTVTNMRFAASAAGQTDEEYVKAGVPMGMYRITFNSVKEYLTYALNSIKSSVKEEMLVYCLADKYGIKVSDSSITEETAVLTDLQSQLLNMAVEKAVAVESAEK